MAVFSPEVVYLNVEESSLPFFQALASKARMDIISLLKVKEMSIKEMGETLQLSSAIVTKHIQILEEAGIVEAHLVSGKRGLKKMCRLKINEAQIIFDNNYGMKNRSFYQVDIPISAYDQCEVTAPCGMAEAERIFGHIDDARYFHAPNRNRCVCCGFPPAIWNTRFLSSTWTWKTWAVEITLEICSEFPGYNAVHPSDIDFFFNGKAIGNVDESG